MSKPPTNPGKGQNRVTIAGWQGPLPHPTTLQQYDQVVPGLSEKLVHVFLSEVEHRQGLEVSQQENENSDCRVRAMNARAGIVLATLTLALPLIVTLIFVVKGEKLEAVASFLTSLGLVYYGKRSKRKG